MHDKAESQGFYGELVRVHILKSKLLIIDGKMEEGLKLLEKAKTTAREKGLILFFKQAQHEEEIMIEKYEELRNMIENNASISERIDKLQLLEYIKNAQKMVRST